MGTAKVTLSVLRTTAESQKGLANEFDSYVHEMSSVRSYFSSLGASAWNAMPGNIETAIDRLSSCQSRINSASNKLQEVIAQYEKSENAVLGIRPVAVRADAAGAASGSQSDKLIAELKKQGYDVSGITNMDVTTYQYIMRTGKLPRNYSALHDGMTQSDTYIADLRSRGFDVSGITNMDTATYQYILKNRKIPEIRMDEATYLNIRNSRLLPETQEYDFYSELYQRIIDSETDYDFEKIVIHDIENKYKDKNTKNVYRSPEFDRCDFTTIASIVGTNDTIYLGDCHYVIGNGDIWLNSGVIETEAEFGAFKNENGDVCFGAAGSIEANYYLAKAEYEKECGTSGFGGSVEGSVEVASAEGKAEGKLGYFDNKVNAYASVSGQLTAVEGSLGGSITFLGITFEAKATGGVGVGGHASIGVVDSKAVFDVAAGIGPYAGLSVSIDPSGFFGAVEEGLDAIVWLWNDLWS